MPKAKTTLMIDDGLMKQVRVRAARMGKRDSEVLEEVLAFGLGAIERMRMQAALSESEAELVAESALREVRQSR